MENFWDYNVWGFINLLSLLLVSLLAGNLLKKYVPGLKKMLIPTSVLGGLILILVETVYEAFSGNILYDTAFFGGNGTATLEVLTYHTLALGFTASAMKSSGAKLGKKRTAEIFNTGVTTVSTYLMQAVLGMGITMVAALLISGFFPAAGVLLPFGLALSIC